MAKGHAYLLEGGPTLAVGIHPHRHGGAGTEAGQQQIIGSRSRIVADRTWLVGGQPVLSGDDLLRVGAGARLRDDHGASAGGLVDIGPPGRCALADPQEVPSPTVRGVRYREQAKHTERPPPGASGGRGGSSVSRVSGGAADPALEEEFALGLAQPTPPNTVRLTYSKGV